MSSNTGDRILFFDGYCGLCNGYVNRVMRWDKRRNLRFATLQGNTARSRGIFQEGGDPDSIIYLDGQRIYEMSDAVLRSLSDLGGLWKLVMVFFVVPRFIRNGVYRWVARNRYQWFGRKDSCRMPTREERNYFLD